jgi:CRISPR-associated protein Cas5d
MGIYPSLRNSAKTNEAEFDLSYYTYLRDVDTRFCSFRMEYQLYELTDDRNENKHHNIAKRCVTKGGRRDIFLGTRECQGYVVPCDFEEGAGFYDNYGELGFGLCSMASTILVTLGGKICKTPYGAKPR